MILKAVSNLDMILTKPIFTRGTSPPPFSNQLCPLETTCLQGAIFGDPMKAGSIKGIQASSQEAAPASPVPLHAQPHFQGNKSTDNCAPLTARNIPPLPGLR